MRDHRKPKEASRAELQQKDMLRRQQLAERLKPGSRVSTTQVVAAQRPIVGRRLPDQVDIVTAARNLPLIPSDDVDAVPMGPTKSLVHLIDAFAEAQRQHRSEVVLTWPSAPPGISTIHALTVQTLLSAAAPTVRNSVSSRPEPPHLRTLYFPWVKTSSAHQKHVLVDRRWLCQVHKQHLNLAFEGGSTGKALATPRSDFHKAMLRLQDLDGNVTDGRGRLKFLPEFRHPNLRELCPQIEVGKNASAKNTLLHRVMKFTRLSETPGLGQVNEPSIAPYMLFGLRKETVDTLKDLRSDYFDVLLVDATSRACRRFGDDWKKDYASSLRKIRRYFGGQLPCLVVTDNPFVYEIFRRELLPVYEGQPADAIKKSASAGHALLSRVTPVIASQQGREAVYEGPAEVKAVGFGGMGADIFTRINEVSQSAIKIRDDAGLAALRQLKTVMRRCVNLPGGIDDLDDFVAGEEGVETAIQVMNAYRPQSVLAPLSDCTLPIVQIAGDTLDRLKEDVGHFFREHGRNTPMAVALAATVEGLLGRSSKILLAMRNGTVVDFAMHVLSSHPEIGARVKQRLEKDMLIPTDISGVDAILRRPERSERGHYRSQIGWLVLVCPPRAEATRVMSLEWLPKNVILLGDSDFLRGVAADAERLSRHTEFGRDIQARLLKLSVAAIRESVRSGGGAVSLTWDEPPPDEIDFTLENRVIDLVGSGSGPSVQIRTSNGYLINARLGTELVSCDWNDPANPFHCIEARNLHVGDEIAVLGESFFDTARTLLDIRATAADGLRQYHETVRDALSAIPGSTRTEKAAAISALMGDDSVQPRVREWINVDEYLTQDPTIVRPHAPQDSETFESFIQALGKTSKTAELFWIWAVMQTRSRRLSAASQFHDAYLKLLVDPSALIASQPRVADGIKALRRIAEQNVGEVLEVRSLLDKRRRP